MILYEQKLKFLYKIQINKKKIITNKKIIKIFINIIQKRNVFFYKRILRMIFLFLIIILSWLKTILDFFLNFFEIKFEDIMFLQSSLSTW